MAKTKPLVVRFPEGVYNEIERLVDEGWATTKSGLCRQIVTAKIMEGDESVTSILKERTE